jgi:bifunctional enzyme CysN/CysC
MPWYAGPTVLEYLETVDPGQSDGFVPFRFPVQLVIRPNGDFRGYAGQVASGRIRPGDPVVVLPSRLASRVSSISAWDGNPAEATPPMSTVLCLEDQLDISRGDMLVAPDAQPFATRRFSAMLIWMSASPSRSNTPYLLKHTTRQVCANIRRVTHTIDIETLDPAEGRELQLNDIAEVEIETHSAVYFDRYRENRATGSFILIDMASNHTVGAGMILDALDQPAPNGSIAAPVPAVHSGLTVWFTGLSGAGKSTLCEAVRDRLAARGYRTDVLDGDVVRKHLSKGLGFSREDRDENIRRIGFVAGLLMRNGVIVLVAAISPYRSVREEVRASLGDFVEVYVNASLEVCETRDPKGLYRRARAGEMHGLTGVDDPYEPPVRPDVECRTDRESVEESVEKVIQAIERGLTESMR